VVAVAGLRKQGDRVRQFILENVGQHRADIVTFTSDALGISRQAVNKHIQRLIAQETLEAEGTTRSRRYALRVTDSKKFNYYLEGLREDVVWRNDVASLFSDLPANIRDIWQYGFSEMLNNAIDHSAGFSVIVLLGATAIARSTMIWDDGEGIFKKINRELGLDDERHAVLELHKGKLTTDPEHHTGEGIFFSSRMFDDFVISSGDVAFSHHAQEGIDWLIDNPNPNVGTRVMMRLRNNTARTTKEIFDSFSDDEDGFAKTIVPVQLAQYGDEKLISRSQAKRLLARIDRFKTVVLDFENVQSIGQAFADEIFRVFAREHPDIILAEINAVPAVKQMINRARQHQ
jgi:hypothetical protein